MIKIKTYIKKDKIIPSLHNLEENYKNYFCLCDREDVLKNVRDFEYMEGAIWIHIDGEVLMGFEQWDLVVALWTYILEAIRELLKGENSVNFYFPDQPIKVQMKKIPNNRLLISVDRKKVTVDESEFLDSALTGAHHFFEILKAGSSGNCATHSMKMLKDIESMARR